MSASDKTKNGNWKDYVRHFGHIHGGEAICGNKNAGFVTKDETDVDCKKCLKKITPPFTFLMRTIPRGNFVKKVIESGTYAEAIFFMNDNFRNTQYERHKGFH